MVAVSSEAYVHGRLLLSPDDSNGPYETAPDVGNERQLYTGAVTAMDCVHVVPKPTPLLSIPHAKVYVPAVVGAVKLRENVADDPGAVDAGSVALLVPQVMLPTGL